MYLGNFSKKIKLNLVSAKRHCDDPKQHKGMTIDSTWCLTEELSEHVYSTVSHLHVWFLSLLDEALLSTPPPCSLSLSQHHYTQAAGVSTSLDHQDTRAHTHHTHHTHTTKTNNCVYGSFHLRTSSVWCGLSTSSDSCFTCDSCRLFLVRSSSLRWELDWRALNR